MGIVGIWMVFQDMGADNIYGESVSKSSEWGSKDVSFTGQRSVEEPAKIEKERLRIIRKSKELVLWRQ